MVDFQLLHQRCIALVLAGSRGLPPRERGMSSSMTVSAGSWCGALGLSGCPQSAQCVEVALMRATSCLRLCPFRLWGLMSLVRGMRPLPGGWGHAWGGWLSALVLVAERHHLVEAAGGFVWIVGV